MGTDANTNAAPARATDAGLFPAIELDEVNARAGLQTRFGAKYLVTPQTYAAFVARLAEQDDWSCLELSGRREFRYVSTYFDPRPAHLPVPPAGPRRRRYKVRIRMYSDTGGCAFELKLEGARTRRPRSALPTSPRTPAI